MGARDDAALSDLRYYLLAWRQWLRSWRPALGYPSETPMVRLMRPVVAWGNSDDGGEFHDLTERVDQHVLRVIDTEVENMRHVKPNWYHALRVVWLREDGPAVWRSNRLSMEDVARLADAAEIELIPRLRAKGVVLGGA